MSLPKSSQSGESLTTLQELTLENNRTLIDLKSSLGSLHAKIDSMFMNHEQRLKGAFEEIKGIKDRINCDVCERDIDRLKGDRKWLTECVGKNEDGVRISDKRIDILEKRVETNETKNSQQEDRYRSAMKVFYGVMVIVIAAAIIAYFQAHWKVGSI